MMLTTSSPTAPTAAPQASFAANWFVSGIARLANSDFVTIKSRDLTTQFSLYGLDPVDGVSLASVNWSDDVGRTTIILKKGTEPPNSNSTRHNSAPPSRI